MNTICPPSTSAPLAAYTRNVTKSHAGWAVELACVVDGRAGPALLAGEPLRGLSLAGEDLVLESGPGPGRPHRLVLAGPFEFTHRHRGTRLELQLAGPRGVRHRLVLTPA